MQAAVGQRTPEPDNVNGQQQLQFGAEVGPMF
jgi:hypothetical protein